MQFRPEDCDPREVYKLMTGIVVPRPIAFVSSRNEEGIDNLAPFSFYTAVTHSPPIVMISIGERRDGKKDTLDNIENRKEFVINLVTEEIAVPMNNAAAEFKTDISEFEEVGLTPIPAEKVDCMVVKESPVHMECVLEKVIPVGDYNHMVLGRVVHFDIDDAYYLGDHKIDVEKLKPLARINGPSYAKLGAYFSLEKNYDPNKTID